MHQFYLKGLICLVILFFQVGCGDDNKSSSIQPSLLNLLSKSKKIEDVLTPIDSVFFKAPKDVILNVNPHTVIKNESGDFIWIEHKPPIYIFDSNGRYKGSFIKQGRGPRELQHISSAAVNTEGDIFLFDNSQKRISIYNKSLDFIVSHTLEIGGFKKMIVDKNDNIYILRVGREMNLAISKYSVVGSNIENWGTKPETSAIQDILIGGGIIQDYDNNIFYSYMSDHRIWKIDTNGNILKILNDKPVYFRQADKSKVQSFAKTGNTRELIRYSWNTSRVYNLYFLSPGLIFQAIETGNPRKGEKVFLHVEIWETVGNKLISQIEIPKRILFTHKEEIYFLHEPDLDEVTHEKNLNPIIVQYKLKLQNNR